jgi:hemoglobin
MGGIMEHSLFEQVGGFAKVRLVVSDFYDRVLDSEKLAPYFADTDVRRLVDHQTKMLAAMMGGPAAYTDDHLHRAHAHLAIRPDDYDEIIQLLRESLEDAGIGDLDVDRVVAHVESLRDRIVKNSPVGAD